MCIFCEEIKNPRLVKKVFGQSFKYNSRIIYSDKNILAIPGYGPQVYPNILIMTRRHIASILNITIDERRSFFDFFEILLQSGLYEGDALCIFEHGGEPRYGCSSVTHCHLHIIEEKYGLFDAINWGKDQENIVINKTNQFVHCNEYLLIGRYKSGRLSVKLNKTPANEHQYFRKYLAHILNSSEWDWRIGMNNDLFVPKLIEEARRKLIV